MPAILDLTFHSLSGKPPRQFGPALQAAFLKTVEAHSESLSAYLHGGVKGAGGRFPLYSLSIGTHDKHQLSVRVGLLDDSTVHAVAHALDESEGFRLGYAAFELVRIDVWGKTAEDLLDGQQPLRSALIHLETPTLLRSSAKNTGFPVELVGPRVLLHRLVRRIGALYPDNIDSRHHGEPNVLSPLCRYVELLEARVKLESILIHGASTYECGTVGQLSISVPKRVPADEARTIWYLLSHAPYCGLGDQTTIGAGRTRLDLKARPA